MTVESKIRRGVEARLHSLHITPAADGSDVGIFDAAVSKATDAVLSASGFDTVPDELVGAVCDLAAADYAEYIITSNASDGNLSSKSDGSYSIKYKDGTSRTEKLFSMTEKMRENGIRRADTYRRLRW